MPPLSIANAAARLRSRDAVPAALLVKEILEELNSWQSSFEFQHFMATVTGPEGRMDKLKKARAVYRATFTKLNSKVLDLCKAEEPILQDIHANFNVLEQKADALFNVDKEMFNALLETNASESDLEVDLSTTDEYANVFNKTRLIVDSVLKTDVEIASKNDVKISNVSLENVDSHKRRFKLPMIEFIKFSGKITEWLPFWSQFKIIDADVGITNEDKFQYLLQATLPRSRARLLAIESLKSRFGRDDLLVEVYVRELLKLVLRILNDNVTLSVLYDKLEAQLRALETLNVTSDIYAAMLFPLVESCLPEEVLRVWQRNTACDRGCNLKDQLNNLMTFLRREVENEERISLVVSGFEVKQNNVVTNKSVVRGGAREKPRIPTAATLVNREVGIQCIFCDRYGHKMEECFKAKRLTLKMKHGLVVMCPKFDEEQDKNVPSTSKQESGNSVPSVPVENSLTNTTHPEVILQTLKVFVYGQDNKGRSARVLIDTGSQRSYITENLAKEMKYPSTGEVKTVHALFGGDHTAVVTHNLYKLRIRDFNGVYAYACNFDVLDQPVICGAVLPAAKGDWMEELNHKNIQLSDDQAGIVEILIGADIAGKLFTGSIYVLKCGLVAVETKLGWTLMGKSPVELTSSCCANMVVTSLLSKDVEISNLWKLDILESKWWEGPAWLKEPKDDWPRTNLEFNELEINEEKIKCIGTSLACTELLDTNWYYKYFSKFQKICRMIAWIVRFMNNCRNPNQTRRGLLLSVGEIEDATCMVFKLVQIEVYQKEDKSITSLKPFLDKKGLLRVQTRITERKDSDEFIYPILLPGDHPVVKRLIFEKHVQFCHTGIQNLLSILREEYWIVKGRKSVRNVISRCVVCRRYKAKELQTSPVALPQDRVRDAAVFEVTGKSGVSDCDVADAASLKKRVRYTLKISQNLRKRFRNEYLGKLIEFSKRQTKGNEIKTGDVVLIKDGHKRLDWLLGVVLELLPGKDGEVRLVRLKTASGSFLRPVQRLCLFETTPWDTQNFLKEQFRVRRDRPIKLKSQSETRLEESKEKTNVFTRSGRQVKPLVRY
ncbi:hypothetical protein NQ317_007577 [Molorchus minor]|uniref:Uncharacterized protein n=1 Tax=Molorchus minor TaxID=1323400 RepID=A0ABQ9J7W8_9CUCU|nr:hypothetical protein NQ317_007577 [Molorchus minor]